ncbi:MAG: hypothetical protein ACYS7Y_00960 [Planctomycetota bacterium]|jgi:hypothetical protein
MIKTTQLILLSIAALSARSSALEPTYLEIKHPDGMSPKGAQFGNSIAILDFDADGHQDVAAAASGQSRVYIFFGPTFRRHLSFAPPGDPQLDHFGYDIAAGPVDSVPGDELIISAPDRKVGGADRAGMLYVFGAGLKEPVLLTAPGFGADERLGNSVTVGDFDADGRMDIAGGASGYRDTRETVGKVYLFRQTENSRELRFTAIVVYNHQQRGLRNFGHDLSAADWNQDGKDDLFISAIWNKNKAGVEQRGQVIVLLAPIGSESEHQQRLIFEDPLADADDEIVRWGMSIDAREDTLLVGSPRHNVGDVLDGGMGFVFRPGKPPRHMSPRPQKNGILGYRVRLADIVGDSALDIAFMSLPRGTYIWDGSRMDEYRFMPRPPGAGSHWCAGVEAGQLVPGGKEELVLGDSRWRPRGEPYSSQWGRVLVVKMPQ